jgi:hypothetical protein
MYSADLFYREGLWLYVYRSADLILGNHKSTISGYLNYRMHDDSSTGITSSPTSGTHTIYVGDPNPLKTDLDFSIRDFYIDYTSGDLMNVD